MSTITAKTELKALQRRKTESDARLKQFFEERVEISQRINQEQQLNHSILQAIVQLKDSQKEPIVSEHAQLRYLERVLGMDLAELSKKVLPEDVIARIKQLGDGTYSVDTHKIKVRGGVVVTIFAPEEKEQ